MGFNPTINVPHQIQLGAQPSIPDKNGIIAESTDVFELLFNSEAVGVGYCDIRERFFYPTNVCPVNSYSVLLHPSLPNKNEWEPSEKIRGRGRITNCCLPIFFLVLYPNKRLG
jgi:hypothetical protein